MTQKWVIQLYLDSKMVLESFFACFWQFYFLIQPNHYYAKAVAFATRPIFENVLLLE